MIYHNNKEKIANNKEKISILEIFFSHFFKDKKNIKITKNATAQLQKTQYQPHHINCPKKTTDVDILQISQENTCGFVLLFSIEIIYE